MKYISVKRLNETTNQIHCLEASIFRIFHHLAAAIQDISKQSRPNTFTSAANMQLISSVIFRVVIGLFELKQKMKYSVANALAHRPRTYVSIGYFSKLFFTFPRTAMGTYHTRPTRFVKWQPSHVVCPCVVRGMSLVDNVMYRLNREHYRQRAENVHAVEAAEAG